MVSFASGGNASVPVSVAKPVTNTRQLLPMLDSPPLRQPSCSAKLA